MYRTVPRTVYPRGSKNQWIYEIVNLQVFPVFGRPATHPKIIKNRLNFAHSKIRQKPWFLPDFDPKTGVFTDFPVYGGSKFTKKTSKNDDGVSGFFVIFWPKSQYMGPPKPPKSWFFGHFGPPPKIIKNRLNFACSKIPKKTVFS